MSSTKICKLSEVITIQNGYAFASKKFTAEEGMPLIRIRDLKNGITTQTKYSGDYDEAYLVKSGDLLIGMDGEFKCYEWKGSPALLNQRVCRIQNINETFDLKYLYYGINSYLKAIEDVTGYTTVKHLSSSTILNIEFPIPSLEKQREIVKKLDSAFTEIDLLDDSLVLSEEKANELLHSLLSDSFAYPAVVVEPTITSPKQSVTVKLVALKDVVSFEKKQGSFDLAYVGLEDIESNTGSHLGSLEPRKVKSNTFAFTSEHLLYGRLRPYLNKVLLPNFDGHCSTEIFPIKVSKDVLREYLFYWFRLQSTVEAINETSTGARMPRANMDAVLEFEIPLPPIAKQREIVAKLDSVFAEIESLKAQISVEKGYVVALRQSLLSSAFTQEETVA